MLNILLGIATFVLILVSLFLILVVLAQKSKSDGGMGAAMGGGMAEATFGAETSSVLTKLTIYSAALFFVLGLGLYLGRLYQYNNAADSGALPTIPAAVSTTAAPSTESLLNSPAPESSAPAAEQ